MISNRLRNLLDQNGVAYEVVAHDPAFTAQQLAARLHVPGREFVKAVVVKLDGRYALAAVPAHRLVDEKALARVAGAARCELATEAEFRDLFPECELGAMPPVGRLYDLPTYVDEEVTRDERIVANAGTHAEAVRLRYQDLARVVQPVVGSFGTPPPSEQPRRAGSTRTRAPRAHGLPRGGSARPATGRGKKKADGKKAARKPAARRGRTTSTRKKAAGRKRSARKKKTTLKKGREKTAREKASRRKTASRKTGSRKTGGRKATRKAARKA